MTHTWPRGLDGRRVRQLLSKARHHRSCAARVDTLSRLLLGCPYEAHGLVGSAGTPEVFTASLERFDCVTYVETVLALSRSTNASELADWLRRIRYDDGRIDWRSRNHYMTGWIRNNARIGVVRPVRPGPEGSRNARAEVSGEGRRGLAVIPGSTRERRLDAVPGLPPVQARFACVPKRQLKRLEPRLATGDVIFFASTRRNLDVFHCGILVAGDQGWRMRHAARSRGSVVEQDLDELLGSNRMAGVIVVRPLGEERL